MQIPDLQQLLAFIYFSFQHRYNNSGISDDDTPKGDNPSFRIEFNDGEWKDWKYEDRFYGSEPFAGNIQIFYTGQCYWYMDVQGKCLSDNPETIAEIYKCLGEAFKATPPLFPFRGPSAYIATNGLRYANIGHGSVRKCYGQESIKDTNDNWLFEVNWRGGTIGIS